ncbi:MAG TPA: hypothetical protein VK534_01885, partial [Methylomirabilota bacterium]|nr:hypothetical protein [Methylomirabilota bacterium]
AKLISGLIVVGIIGLITLATTLVCMHAINYNVSITNVVLVTGMSILLSLLFGAVAWALVGIGRLGHRASIGVASFVALGSYLISSLESLATWLEWPAKLLPFHYFQPSAILEGNYNWWNALGMLIATLALLAIAFIGFRRRDLN